MISSGKVFIIAISFSLRQYCLSLFPLPSTICSSQTKMLTDRVSLLRDKTELLMSPITFSRLPQWDSSLDSQGLFSHFLLPQQPQLQLQLPHQLPLAESYIKMSSKSN